MRIPYHKYQEYLRSYKWRKLRQLALEHTHHRCSSCGSTYKLEVHHRTYDRLGNEKLSDLQVLCMICHQRAHNPTAEDIRQQYEERLKVMETRPTNPYLFNVNDKTGRITRKITTRRPKYIPSIEDFTLDKK